ncbi:MAG TPA: reverse transcriptase domain-containing protein [Ruminiclostridium sp.]
MRNPITVLKSLSGKSETYEYERLYRNLYNPELYLLAYKNIAASEGSMTKGTDGKTIDDMSMGRIQAIIASLKDHSYQPNPAKRTYIAKKNSTKKRPLGIPSTDDKLVQEIVRMILESIYESSFSQNSHGFMPGRSCHTALKQIKNTFTGINWFVEGDIKACFDSFNHQVLIEILRRRIKDEYFISLMWKFLKAGYMEQWEYNKTYSGIPQGSGFSPILANIYLNELDVFMEKYKKLFDVGTARKRIANPKYTKARDEYHDSRGAYGKVWGGLDDGAKKIAVADMSRARQKMQTITYFKPMDKAFKRIQYCRYADDFLIGIIGSMADAGKVKDDIKEFLVGKLKLEMSEEKTKITHSKDKARFLSYDITVSKDNNTKRDKTGRTRRYSTGRIKLYVPREKWEGKLKEYQTFKVKTGISGKEKWLPIHRGKLINNTDVKIVSTYNAEIRGLYNYYCMANNATVLSNFYYIMEYSMYKTFAAKYKISMPQAITKFSKDGDFVVNYPVKNGTRQCIFYNNGFRKKEFPMRYQMDALPQYKRYDRPNTLAGRLKSGICELCGIKTEDIRMHHVRKLADLTENTAWELCMLKKRRKSLAVCADCNNIIHSDLG